MAARLRVLAIAAATGRVAYVLFIGGNLCDWGVSGKASKSPAHALKQAEAWFERFQPHVVVTESAPTRRRKGENTNGIVDAIAYAANSAELSNVSIPRSLQHRNKYAEARALGERFPVIKAWVPIKPRIWESEPRYTVVFEALSLALQIVDGPGEAREATLHVY